LALSITSLALSFATLPFAARIAAAERPLLPVGRPPLLSAAASTAATTAEGLQPPYGDIDRLEVGGMTCTRVGLLRCFLFRAQQFLQSGQRIRARGLEPGFALDLLAMHLDAGDEVRDLVACVLWRHHAVQTSSITVLMLQLKNDAG
jgi:hypothetical protein